MELQFASRMDQFQAGIFSVLDQKRREAETEIAKIEGELKQKLLELRG